MVEGILWLYEYIWTPLKGISFSFLKHVSGKRDVESLKAFVLDEAEKAAKGKLDSDKDSL